VALLAVAVLLLLRAALAHTGGTLVYALDDAYIHMAVARSLAEHGVWGVTRYGFTACTSSLAWPILLALGDLVGLRDAAPLALNLAAAVAALWLADHLLAGAPVAWRVVALVAIVFLTPLPTLVLAGMEHTLHIAAVFWLFDRFRAVEESDPGGRAVPGLAVAAALATATRYESLFLVLPAVVLLARDGRRTAAITAAIGGLLPPLAFAAVSVTNGWPPVPTSLLLKRATYEAAGLPGIVERLGGHAVRTLTEAPHLVVLLAAVLLMSAALPTSRVVRRWDAIYVVGTLLHVQLAAIGWLFRYEAYLVALGLVLVARHLADGAAALRGPVARPALVLAALVAAAPLLTRGVQALAQTPTAVKNIYEQQYQMGLFLRELPAGSAVMANDIGAIAYLADVRLVDLFGLATRETAEARRAGRVDQALLARLAAAARPAAIVIYRSWFADAVPPDWVEVGTWKVPDKVVVADRTVSFYAPDAASAASLGRALAAFQSRLPGTVVARRADAAP
jgi:hypothetical protein